MSNAPQNRSFADRKRNNHQKGGFKGKGGKGGKRPKVKFEGYVDPKLPLALNIGFAKEHAERYAKLREQYENEFNSSMSEEYKAKAHLNKKGVIIRDPRMELVECFNMGHLEQGRFKLTSFSDEPFKLEFVTARLDSKDLAKKENREFKPGQLLSTDYDMTRTFDNKLGFLVWAYRRLETGTKFIAEHAMDKKYKARIRLITKFIMRIESILHSKLGQEKVTFTLDKFMFNASRKAADQGNDNKGKKPFNKGKKPYNPNYNKNK